MPKEISKRKQRKINLLTFQLGRVPTRAEIQEVLGQPFKIRKMSAPLKLNNERRKKARYLPNSSKQKQKIMRAQVQRSEQFAEKCERFFNLFFIFNGLKILTTSAALAAQLGFTTKDVQRITFTLRHTGCMQMTVGPSLTLFEIITDYQRPEHSRQFYEEVSRENGQIPNTLYHEAVLRRYQGRYQPESKKEANIQVQIAVRLGKLNFSYITDDLRERLSHVLEEPLKKR